MDDDDATLASAPLIARAVAGLSCAMLLTDRDGLIVWVNQAFCRLTGYMASDLVGRSPALLRSGKQDPLFYRKLWRTILSGDAWRGEVVNRRKDGSFYSADEIITPLFDANGDVTHFVAVQIDLAPRKREHSRHRYLAYHDALTRLPNRNRLDELLRQIITQHKQSQGNFSVMFVDLDRFKPVNDNFGHHVGDMLLMAVANRLRAAVRATDVVARLGGDEFIVIEVDLKDPVHAKALAQKLIASLSRAFRLAGHDIQIGASVGLAIFPSDGVDAQTLLEKADAAMYRAKAAGRNCVKLFGEPD